MKTTYTALLGLLWATVAAAQPLDRDLDHYFLLAQRYASLKNFVLQGGCHVGVNCGANNPAAKCGILRFDAPSIAGPSQSVGHSSYFSKPGGQVFQLFANGGGGLNHVTIGAPPVQAFVTPVLPNTCSADCMPDFAAIEAECGFPVPFPACDPTMPVMVLPNLDCLGAADVTPGNGQCDLPAGTYGHMDVKDGARLMLGAGTITACAFRAGHNTLILASGTTVQIPSPGTFKVNNGTTLGQNCGDLRVFKQGPGTISFGRNSSIIAKVCAPEARMLLGHGNLLKGQFVGDVVNADRNNTGQCCGAVSATGCACFDKFSPSVAAVGATVTLTSACDLSLVSAVRICGIVAPIVTHVPDTIEVTVPVGAMGACLVEVVSPGGVFVHVTTLTVP